MRAYHIKIDNRNMKKYVKWVVLGWSIMVLILTLRCTQVESIMARDIKHAEISPVDATGFLESYEAYLDKIEQEKIDKRLESYKKIGGIHYSDNIPLEIVDKVLMELGLEENETLIKAMFYVGTHESHWNVNSISNFVVAGENPQGIFQFLPSTFRSVSSGNIFNEEDQIRAFIEMVRRGRVDEFHVVWACNFEPCITKEEQEEILQLEF